MGSVTHAELYFPAIWSFLHNNLFHSFSRISARNFNHTLGHSTVNVCIYKKCKLKNKSNILHECNSFSPHLRYWVSQHATSPKAGWVDQGFHHPGNLGVVRGIVAANVIKTTIVKWPLQWASEWEESGAEYPGAMMGWKQTCVVEDVWGQPPCHMTLNRSWVVILHWTKQSCLFLISFTAFSFLYYHVAKVVYFCAPGILNQLY